MRREKEGEEEWDLEDSEEDSEEKEKEEEEREKEEKEKEEEDGRAAVGLEFFQEERGVVGVQCQWQGDRERVA